MHVQGFGRATANRKHCKQYWMNQEWSNTPRADRFLQDQARYHLVRQDLKSRAIAGEIPKSLSARSSGVCSCQILEMRNNFQNAHVAVLHDIINILVSQVIRSCVVGPCKSKVLSSVLGHGHYLGSLLDIYPAQCASSSTTLAQKQSIMLIQLFVVGFALCGLFQSSSNH